MAKIVKNTTASAILVSDTGVSIPATSSYTIPGVDYPLWSYSSDIVTHIGSGAIVINDGSFDLSKADGISLLQGNFKQSDFIPSLKTNDRLRVDVSGLSTDNLVEGTNQFFTNERAQDAVGNSLLDTASVDFTYDDAGNSISAAVLPAGVNHNALSNYVANQHIDHSAVNVTAGTGLTGGGTIAASRTLSISNTTVTAAAYGSSSQVPTYTVNAQGQLTAAANVTVDKLYDHWNGTTQYNASQLRKYTNVGTTDANGRVTVNLTQNGLVGGTALFSTVFSAQAIGVDGSGVAIQAINMFVESISATQVVFRATRGTSVGVLVGGTIISIQFAGAGYTVYVIVEGAK
jgi:hypothetical protein